MKKVWQWVKAHWKVVLYVAAAVGAVLLGREVVVAIRKAFLGTVMQPGNFHPLDDKHITVQAPDGTWVVRQIPDGVRSSQDVTAAQYDPATDRVVAQTGGPVIDRR